MEPVIALSESERKCRRAELFRSLCGIGPTYRHSRPPFRQPQQLTSIEYM
eukprot:SAG25_NODE_7092_length_505_cov_1.130542_1_plen_49_part_10